VKLVTSIPATVARLGDLVERDVTSDLEIHQESILTLPPIPHEVVAPGTNAAIQRTSFAIDRFVRLINPDPLFSETFVFFGRGLWKLNFTFSHRANFEPVVRDDCSRLSLVNAALGVNVALMLPVESGSAMISGEHTFSLPVDGYSLELFVGAPLGAGGLQRVGVCVVGSKLL